MGVFFMKDLQKLINLVESTQFNESTQESKIQDEIFDFFEQSVNGIIKDRIEAKGQIFKLNGVERDGEEIIVKYNNEVTNDSIKLSLFVNELTFRDIDYNDDDATEKEKNTKVVTELYVQLLLSTFFETDDGEIEISSLDISDSFDLVLQKEDSYLGQTWDNMLDHMSEKEVVESLEEVNDGIESFLKDTSYDLTNYIKLYY